MTKKKYTVIILKIILCLLLLSPVVIHIINYTNSHKRADIGLDKHPWRGEHKYVTSEFFSDDSEEQIIPDGCIMNYDEYIKYCNDYFEYSDKIRGDENGNLYHLKNNDNFYTDTNTNYLVISDVFYNCVSGGFSVLKLDINKETKTIDILLEKYRSGCVSDSIKCMWAMPTDCDTSYKINIKHR